MRRPGSVFVPAALGALALILGALAACEGGASSSPDGAGSAAPDAARPADSGGAPDVPASAPDVGEGDAAVDLDAAGDGSAGDTGEIDGTGGTVDAGPDARPDAGADTATDAGEDAAPDAGEDTAPDAADAPDVALPERRLEVVPGRVTLGAVPVGETSSITVQLRSVGREPVILRRAYLADDDRAVFTISATWAPPRVLPMGGSRPLTLTYAPRSASRLDEHGQPVPDAATLVVESDAEGSPLAVPIEGVGEGDPCPSAVVSIDEVPQAGGSVHPGRLLHLRGGESRATYEPITEFRWSVDAPTGCRNGFWPSAGSQDPTFRVDLAGAYRFRLSVVDALGLPGCDEAVFDVAVPPPHPIYVEVVWDTPGDPDPWDEGPGVGSDVDLHLVHPDAPADPATPDRDGDGDADPWFDARGDCWSGHPTTDWGAALVRADVDGDGPEAVGVADPEDGAEYRIAVHYAEANGTGDVTATARVHVNGAVAFEWPDASLHPGDLWCVASVHWPSGHVERCVDEDTPDGRRVTPDYEVPAR